MEKEIKFVLKKLLESFLKARSEERFESALTIDHYATMIHAKYKKEISPDLEDTLSNLMTMHHWGDKEIPPTFNIRGIKELVKSFSHD